jgi:hypothetical protein
MNMAWRIAEFEGVKALRETLGGGLLCRIEGKDVWIPKTMIDRASEVSSEGDEGTLVLEENFAIEKGLV